MERAFLLVRRVVVFVLGVAVVVDALLDNDGATLGRLIVGLLMIGVLPIDYLVDIVHAARAPRGRERAEP